jgi:type VI protein secretion system component Hcp
MEVAYIAFKSRDVGWVNAATGVDLRDYLSYQSSTTASDSEDQTGPPLPEANTYYIPVWEFAAEAKREYGGINSSGGPQVSGRADQSDFSIEIPTTAASPVLYEHCCSGKQFSWIHVVAPNWKAGSGAWLHIRMKDVNVTGFEFSGVRWLKDDYDTADGAVLNASTEINFKYNSTMYDIGHYDDLTLLYTSIEFDFVGQCTRGWDTGSDSPSPPRPTP